MTRDDPLFPATVYVRLIEGENDRHNQLVAQQAQGGLTAVAPCPLRWSAIFLAQHFERAWRAKLPLLSFKHLSSKADYEILTVKT